MLEKDNNKLNTKEYNNIYCSSSDFPSNTALRQFWINSTDSLPN